MPSAPISAKAASPISVLMPSRLAPAAPANAPCGTASATKAAPRSTTKKPTTPAITATIEPVIQVFTMNEENMSAPHPAAAPGRLGDEERHEDQRDDEEADRPVRVARRPVHAVVGQHDADPGRRDPGHRGQRDG